MMINGEVSLILNTPAGKSAATDDSYMRKNAIKHRIPYLTTTDAAKAAANGVYETLKNGQSEVLSLQEWHEMITDKD